MEIIQFDLRGPLAHFRKIYGTNTALTYHLPPRTTLTGLLASMLGMPKESYHEEMAPENLRVGVGLVSPVKKTFHRVNNLMIKGKMDFAGRLGHTQTPIELISGRDIRRDVVHYRVFLGAGETEQGQLLYSKLKTILRIREWIFAPCLGAAFCPAFIGETMILNAAETNPGEPLSLHTSVNREWIDRFDLDRMRGVAVDEDLYPLSFARDRDRELGASIRLTCSLYGKSLPVRLNRPAFAIEDVGGPVHITFLEN